MAKKSSRRGFEIPVFRFEEFGREAQATIIHGFFGREGGVSEGVYQSLNCGPGSGDDYDKVKANLQKITDALDIKPGNILIPYQVHGRYCILVSEKLKRPHTWRPWDFHGRPEADAIVTDEPGIAIGILTADCVPVLFYGQGRDPLTGLSKPVIGAAHAGWRGALEGILEATWEEMWNHGVKTEDMEVAIGPCIQKQSYEVTEEFHEKFLMEDLHKKRSPMFFHPSAKPGHLMFDLPGYCAMRLELLGVKKIYNSGVDTYSSESAYFSYRRATHRGEKDYGRQISVISIV